MSQHKNKIILTLLLVTGLTLRLFHLDYSDFWHDEMVSLHFAKDPSWTSIFWDNTPFLYNMILKIWVSHWGLGEGITRLLSVFFSLGTLVLFYYLGSTRAALIYLFSSFSLYYAREVRVYAMFEFFATLNLLVFLRKSSDRRVFLSFIPLLLSHYFSLFQFFNVSLWKFVKERKKTYLYVFLGGAVTTLLMFLASVKWESISWMRLRFALEPMSWIPHNVIYELLGASLPLSLLFVVMLLWDLKNWKKLNERLQFLTFNILLCLSVITLLSIVLNVSILIPRYFIFLIPSIILYFDEKLNILKNKRSRAIAYATCLGLASFSIYQMYGKDKSPWSAAADMVAATNNPAVFTTRSLGIQTPYFDRRGIEIRKWKVGPEGIAMFDEALASGRDVWLVETYWGSLGYLGNLNEVLKQRGYKVETHALTLNQVEPIMLMKIQNKK